MSGWVETPVEMAYHRLKGTNVRSGIGVINTIQWRGNTFSTMYIENVLRAMRIDHPERRSPEDAKERI